MTRSAREYVRRPRTGWLDLALGELWEYRDLLGALAEAVSGSRRNPELS